MHNHWIFTSPNRRRDRLVEKILYHFISFYGITWLFRAFLPIESYKASIRKSFKGGEDFSIVSEHHCKQERGCTFHGKHLRTCVLKLLSLCWDESFVFDQKFRDGLSLEDASKSYMICFLTRQWSHCLMNACTGLELGRSQWTQYSRSLHWMSISYWRVLL